MGLTLKSFEVIHNINRTKEKNHITISIDAENKFNKIEHLFDTVSVN